MKKLIISILLLGCTMCFGAHVTMDLKSKVSRRTNKEKIGYNNSFTEDKTVSRTFTIEVKSLDRNGTPVFGVVAILANNEIDFKTFKALPKNSAPFVYEVTATAKSSREKMDYTYLKDTDEKEGTTKTDICVFLFGKGGHFFGQKYTSKGFADEVAKNYKEEIINLVKNATGN